MGQNYERRNVKRLGGRRGGRGRTGCACSDFSGCVGLVEWLLLLQRGSHTYLPATPAVSVGQAARVDDMVVGDKVEDKDKDENKDTAEEEEKEEADNVKEDESSGTKEVKEKEEEDKDDKGNEGTEDTAAAEAELELSR